jgi:predicted MFS family arabinose efflux permease
VWGSPVLRALAVWDLFRNFFGMFFAALYLLFGLRELGLSPLLIGITVGIGGASNLVGTLLVKPAARRFGPGPTIVGAALVGCLSPVLIPLAPSSVGLGFAVLALAQALDLIHPLYEVNALTLRQLVTPEHLLGRVNATMHVVARGILPFGAIAGGVLADAIGLRPTLFAAAAGIAIGGLWLAASPVRSFDLRASEPAA